jgi:HSP20 family protein
MTLVKWNNGNSNDDKMTSRMPSLMNTRSLLDTFRYPFESVRLLQNLIDEDLGLTSTNIGRSLPAVNISETGDSITIEVAAPGMKKKDFGIEINENKLRISYKKENEVEQKDEKNIWRQEYNFESFERTFSLPETINSDKISANYQEGILTIIAPKKEEAKKKPARSVEIK